MPENTIQDDIKKYINPWKGFVKRRAKGILKHDYLVPGGPYEEQWDWDAFFVGMALSAEIPTEAVFLKNWALNYLESADDTGYVPGCLVPAGFDPRLKQMKPFMAQGCYFASRSLNDFDWLKDESLYQKLIKVVMYRENHGCFDKELNLGGWTNSMESGADNNLASLDYPDNSVASVDFNSFLYLEYQSLSLLAAKTGRAEDAKTYGEKAENLKKAILEKIKEKYGRQPINTEDGLKIEFDSDWVHLRTSNTEPIIRIYAESNFETTANNIAMRLMKDIKEFL